MICLLPTPSLWPYPAALHHRELMTPSIARSGTAAVPPEEREAIAALLCRAVRFPNREAATPGPRPYRGVAHLSSCAAPRFDRGRRAEPMKHLDPKSTNAAGYRVYVLLRLRACGSPKLRCGLWLARLGSIPGQNLIGLWQQSKRFFAGPKCG